MIKVFLTGNIGKDSEKREVGEHTVLSFSVASTKKIKGENHTTWMDVKVWNRDKLQQYLTKGVKVAISGELEVRKHNEKYYYSVICHELEFMSSRQEQKPEQELPKSEMADTNKDSDLPF